ncbi:UDP-N-acetylmuramoyl-L-alanine--D-glutamate ligase [Zymomonas mobilis]|uniref:UDP-N-acetylmuramoylalanine--D-glutamate ligase n=1 Tax=Zymomonas mobilis subsp. pomaceae (strain ATCC 29192 / DSM 22645 / JCM 10191 / CCUG 17912 / NBRC 13757 / NCIMB 11200 / NRRL B-4491 / Barker I) TaxID=579138 RepID=F8EVD0_ZYMMT|nr:UDP-N-acetylmuramoyl-L-alanine--D-glutamate ligase [Zymomonas mobilis]AEI37337.1 UDP-N-acetylmuramoylalanine/D-glutamate ligase [Zymomonas mobilis subsp. pomaceae ATCC 29192]MDX5948705.1 UDP-N-acetylmuramoyl-L-alanine--D-glutamate ligase [Zymomonas mobilis subsp. pomaceae]GEB88510.1 UDP-N-acetylmuramoylalanine--D-glutamate ligase [Zymomonas mobilis subsp. pomaceae]
MIISPVFSGKFYAVLGLARSGLATIDALLASKAKVMAWDNRSEARMALQTRYALAIARGDLLISDPMVSDVFGLTAFVVSPGIPLNRHPITIFAKEAGIPIIGDIELFAQARNFWQKSGKHCPVIGITGTNGKSTTTALIHHILKEAGRATVMGGNIGLPLLAATPLPDGGIYVLELSSYQIDLTFSLDCDIAVLTNITPDHLDRHGGFDGYMKAKARLFGMQSSTHYAVIATDDIPSRVISKKCPARVVTVHADNITAEEQIDWPALQGPHNAQNAVIAIAVMRLIGIDETIISKALANYPGLPHRMQRVAERNGVLFINDSKATNATATAPALAAFPAIHWILGGVPKTEDLDPCKPYYNHVKQAYTIGQAGPVYAALLRESGVAVVECETLEKAVTMAAQAARNDEVVMLTPACASFDQFSDYEARGQAFQQFVEALD